MGHGKPFLWDQLLKDNPKDIRQREACMANNKNPVSGGVSSGAYGLAFIGALVYYIQHATTFWLGVLGFLKAVVWPAVLVYKLLEFLG
jgi:hypothetical protein